jgi:SAM-dependent methyltransferase
MVSATTGKTVRFRCNICDSLGEAEEKELGRDVVSCRVCHSTPRFRAVVHALSTALFGQGLRISEFPARPDLTGIGLTDFGYASRLTDKLGYRNTFYDREPRVDITDPPAELHGTLDFLISSDVFEHVPPPVERAFEGAFQLLKPGGLFVLTVPYLLDGDTVEHFPDLHEYDLVEFNKSLILVNRTQGGRWQVFEHLRFHGGEGATLEMRIFSHGSLLRHLQEAGFDDLTDWRDRVPEFGGCWPASQAHSFPLVARRPA